MTGLSLTVGEAGTTCVMIVDDQAPFRAVARMLVRLIEGWTVVAEAASGEEALDFAVDRRPQVVLMDINLPGISGLEATRRIVERQPDTRVVLVSTYRAEDLPDDAHGCGAVGYIRKEEMTPQLLREVAGGPSRPAATGLGLPAYAGPVLGRGSSIEEGEER